MSAEHILADVNGESDKDYFLVLYRGRSGSQWRLELATKHNGDGLELCRKFRDTCYLAMAEVRHAPNDPLTFHQGGNGTREEPWQLFEFWSNNQNSILTFAEGVATTCELELEIM